MRHMLTARCSSVWLGSLAETKHQPLLLVMHDRQKDHAFHCTLILCPRVILLELACLSNLRENGEEGTVLKRQTKVRS